MAARDASTTLRAADSASLRQSNRITSQKLQHTAAVTDDDIMDEAAGQRRLELAAESTTRRATENARMRQQNDELRRSRETTGARTDNDIMDEAAGRRRLELAAASSARRDQQADSLEQRNEALRQRLKAVKSRTDDGDGGGLFGTIEREALERSSDVWRASYLKFELREDNRQLARAEREELLSMRNRRQQLEEDRLSRAREHIRERMDGRRRVQKLRDDVQQTNSLAVRSSRDEAERWSAVREQQQRRHYKTARVRVVEANELDDRLDLLEAAQDAREREEGTHMKLAVRL